jgi:hypothetical protein
MKLSRANNHYMHFVASRTTLHHKEDISAEDIGATQIVQPTQLPSQTTMN